MDCPTGGGDAHEASHTPGPEPVKIQILGRTHHEREGPRGTFWDPLELEGSHALAA